MQKSKPGDDKALVDEGMKALEMLGSVEPSHLSSEDTELGSFLSSGELPHAQACILYVLRVGVIESLGESGQASSLDSLSAFP